jgi:hypothetical protein
MFTKFAAAFQLKVDGRLRARIIFGVNFNQSRPIIVTNFEIFGGQKFFIAIFYF